MSGGGACEVWFYQLERTPLEQALPDLLEKTLAKGWRALVRGADRDRLVSLDAELWAWKDDSFLPHGLADEPAAERQPVLLTTATENANNAQVLFIVDGAECEPLDGMERCVVLFDGRDEAATGQARERWKRFKAAGHAVSYWRQSEQGGWSKQV